MATRKQKQTKRPPVELDEFESRHHAGTFNLDFLEAKDPPISYEDQLLTAEEKAAYYEDLIQNNGVENFKKMQRDCREKAAKLKKKVAHIDRDEAMPLLDQIAGLESAAIYYGDPTPPEVFAAQKDWGDTVTAFHVSPEQKERFREMGLTGIMVAGNSVDAPKLESEAPDSEQVKELKRKARFWKNIHSWSITERMAYYFCGPVKPADWTEAMFVRAQKDRDAVKVLSWSIRNPMLRLLALADMGIEDAARQAVAELEKYIRLLNLYAKTNPNVFKRVASRLQSWPVVYSPHPRLNQIPQTIAAQIKLGAGIDFEFSRNTKWNPNDLGCKIAMQLYEHIKMMRQYPESNEHSPCLDQAVKLPDIKQSESVKAWWAVAKEVLLAGYAKPEEEDTLRSLTKIKKRFKVRDKILECIENRFFSLFPKEVR